MRLTSRLTAILILGVLALMMVDLFLILKHENEEMTLDMRGDATHLGALISDIVDDLWELGGEARALKTLEQLNAYNERVSIQLVYPDAAPNDAHAPTNPSIDIASIRHVASSHFFDAEGREHLCTYARLTVQQRPAAIEIFEPIDHSSRKSAFFALHAAFLIGATALLGAVLAVVAGGTWVCLLYTSDAADDFAVV